MQTDGSEKAKKAFYYNCPHGGRRHPPLHPGDVIVKLDQKTWETPEVVSLLFLVYQAHYGL